MAISLTKAIAILISDEHRYSDDPSPWKHFFNWVVQDRKHPDVSQDDAPPNSFHQEIEPTQETCAYCSFYEFGWCNFHDKSVASDAELCNEIKQMQ